MEWKNDMKMPAAGHLSTSYYNFNEQQQQKNLFDTIDAMNTWNSCIRTATWNELSHRTYIKTFHVRKQLRHMQRNCMVERERSLTNLE